MVFPIIYFPSIIAQIGDFLAGEYFLNVGGMILRVTDKDDVRERHFDGADVTETNVLSQKYYDPFTGTEIDYKAGAGKEILCYVIINSDGGGGQFDTATSKVWANTTKDSKSGGRDVFGKTFTTGNSTAVTPPFILRENEYMNIERISGADINVFATKIVGVERDAT